MSRAVCGICWCPYDEETGECACAPEGDKESAMNREDIIRMAREAGLHSVDLLDLYGGNVKDSELAKLRGLIRFAHLIYEATFRDANIAASRTILDAAVLQEREACAKVCEEFYSIEGIAQDCAAAIRARSNP